MTDISTVARDLINTDPALAAEVHRQILAKTASIGFGLTVKEAAVLEYLRDRARESDIAPSFEEIMVNLDIGSKSTVHRILTALEERGKIQRLPNRPRAIAIVEKAA
ncbi:LexA family protein [Rhizobium leguminosarum]|uniref:LexA family protein n=1 Tax=Rhizobium leguminosarum TaxID=384 RepID=UPI00048184E8|nr:helix-turn-helix domain-containing protein [Rhizobium leguminosarum]